MSTSTAAFAPRVARFAMIFVLQSMCFAGETSTQSYRFESFAAVNTSPDRAERAGALWKFVVGALHGEYGDGPLQKMRGYFMFTAIGPDTFLVMGPGFYLAKPRAGVFELISPAWHLDAIDLPVFHPLAAGGAWALVRVEASRNGQHQIDVGALFVDGGPAGLDQPAAIYADIGTFESQSLAQPQVSRIVARSP
jgi:hypothetical protein